jgi:hypothetical protein
VGGSAMDSQDYALAYYLIVPILGVSIVMLVFSMWQMRKTCWRDKHKK